MPVTFSPTQPSYIGPGFEDAKVYDAMRVGVVTCRPETTLEDVGRMMVGYGIHSVVVTDLEGTGRPWGVVTAYDVARAAPSPRALTAGDAASTDLVTIDSDAPLEQAAKVMAERAIGHLIAVQPGTDRPVGVISTRALVAALVYGGS